MMVVVRAHPGQAVQLSQIAWQAKAAWKYPARWLRNWREVLNILPKQIAVNHYFVALVDGQIIGFVGLHPAEPAWCLEHLWVLREHWGKKAGRRLFFHGIEFARMHGARGVTIESDPNAEGFYLRMGAVRVGGVETMLDGQPRLLPQLVYTIES